jgi:putative transposase
LKTGAEGIGGAILTERLKVSERRTFGLIHLARSTCQYRSQDKDDTALRIRLKDLAASRVRYGYRRPSGSQVVPGAKRPNEPWSMDFVSDSLSDGRQFRALWVLFTF